MSKLNDDINEAKHRNKNKIEADVKLWLDRTEQLKNENVDAKEKWFGLCTNCFWQHKQGKVLEKKTQTIKDLINECEKFSRLARSTGLPGVKSYSSQNVMPIKGRELKFKQLKEALKDDKKFIVGLQGMGGTGKSTMAIEVGIEVGESKPFDKVIYALVSKDPNIKKIRNHIATHLDLPIKEEMDEQEQAENLLKRIAEGGQKILLMLDDLWEKLPLQDIGIPLGRHDSGSCSILLVTRDHRVCRKMGCRQEDIIQLDVLSDKDARDLFLFHAGVSVDDSSGDLKDTALDIAKECGRLPVAIEAIAKSINSELLTDWKDVLDRL